MSLTIQYIIIAIIFLIAVVFIVKKFMPNKNAPTGACGKGCGCDYSKTTQSKT